MRQLSSLALTVLLSAAAIVVQGCGAANIDVAASIKAGNMTTGWFDAGVVNGKNKLVPSASFTITNRNVSKLGALQVFTVFRLVGETEELGSSLVVLRGNDALAPSATSKPITVRANWGYSGEQPRAQMLMHTGFKDARIEVFAKHGAGAYVKIAEAPVTRQLLIN